MITSPRWRRLRARQISREPLCEICLELNRTTIAQEVHHIIPVERAFTKEEMIQLMYDPSNLQSLCNSCHIDVHRAMNSYDKATIRKNNESKTKRFINKYLK